MSLNQWAFLSGDPQDNDICGNFGMRGVASPTNLPGSHHTRLEYIPSLDALIFATGWGIGECATSGMTQGTVGDVHIFSLSTNMWTYLAGGKGINFQGISVAPGQFNASNRIGSRSTALVSYAPKLNILIIFGGWGM